MTNTFSKSQENQIAALRKAFFVFATLCLGCLFFVETASATEQVRVTVGTTPMQEFKGFGSNNRTLLPETPDACKELITRTLWYDTPFTMFRFFRVLITEWSDEYIINYFREGLMDQYGISAETAARHPGLPADWKLKVLMNPTGTMVDPYTWAERLAHVIDTLEQEYNIQIEYTGVGNEPNQHAYTWAAPIKSKDMPAVVKAVKAALQAKGLNHVKVICPGASNVDNYMWEVVAAIQADPEALAALDAWEYHAYNMSMVQVTYNDIIKDGKEIIQSEASLPEGDHDWVDSMAAAQLSCRFLADMNFGVHYWLHWLDAREHIIRYAGSKIIAYNQFTGEIKPHLKFYYFRQLARTFPPGTIMRKSLTDLDQNPRYGRSSDKYMEYWYGLKIPMSAAAGRRPDGTWGMAAVNHTESRFTEYGSSYYPKEDFDVTFYIEELKDSGNIKLAVWKSNNSELEVCEDTVTMVNGEVTVNIEHCDLISLSQTFDTDFTPIPDFTASSTGGTFSDCGIGVGLALIPPIGFRINSTVSRRKRKRKRDPKRNTQEDV